MSNNKKQSGGLSSWIFPIFMLMVFPPAGILFLVLTALSGSKKTTRGRHPYYSQQQTKKSGPVGARTTGTQTAASHRQTEIQQQKEITALHKKGKKLTTIGGIIAGLFGLCTLISAVDNLWILPDIAWYLSEVIPLLCFTTGGLGCLWAGRRKQKKARRFRNYLAMIGLKKAVSVSSLASASGISVDQVREDLEDMLSDGLFPEGFLDYGKDRLVLSGDGLAEEEPKKAAAPTQSDKENAILAEIRQVNDAIDNEKLSAQIDRIGVITAKILDYQKSHPEKAPQLHSFLSYYLPTTLKILRAYGQLEAQEVAGENITAAMVRIEGMMDKVVEGFEKQLDLLFQGDAMDIATDVDVLERMLAKDGLAGQQGMTLGL